MMKGNKLFLVVTDLCSNALPLTLPTIIFNFNNTGVVRGCVILLPSKFEGRKQIELANERMSVLSPLFDFLIVVNPQKLSREFVKIHNINGFEAFYDELWKEVATLTAIVHSSKSLDEVRRNWEKDKSSKALLQGGALYIIRDKDIDFTIDKKTLLLGVGDAGTGVAEEVHLLGLNNMTVVRLGIGGVRCWGNSYRLDLAGDWNYCNGIDKRYHSCIEFVKKNINVIKYDIEYFLGFDVSCQSDIQIKELEKYSKHGH